MSNKVPQIRFNGYSDAWEQRKLSDFSKTTYGGGTPKTAVTEYWDGNIPWIQSSNLTVDDVQEVNLDKFITDDAIKNSAAKLIPANSIAIVTRVGVGKLTLMKQEFATSQDFLSLSELHVDEQFGLYSIYKLLQKELNNIQGTSIKGMTKADLLTKDIMIPVEKDEQIKIGSFFKQLDHLIALHQRKLAKLKELKQGYLQKLFPKNGSKFPQLRFAGFADAWEQRKLGELVTYQNGVGHEGNQLDEGKYELVNLNSIAIDGGLKNSGKFINKTAETLLKNDLVMVLSDVGHGDLLGRVAIIPENYRYVLNQRVALLRGNSQTNIRFLFSYINAHQMYFKREGAGSSQLNISRGSVERFKVYLPSISEQKKIGAFFKSLDDTIALHQRKLEKLQELKKGYLQKMFV